MTDPSFPAPLGQAAWLAEFARLNKIIQSLMNRAERCARAQSSDLGVFQRTILLEEQVSVRTDELQAALRENEIANRALRESEAKFRSVADQSLVGIVVIDDGKFSYTNAKFNEIFGYDAVEIRHLGPVEVTVESDRALVASQVLARMSGAGDRLAYTFHGLRKDGEVLDIECHSSVIDVGRTLLVSLVVDVTARIRAAREVADLQELLREAATHDALTGLYNRRFLEESFGRDLLLAERSQYPLSVVATDLDHFTTVNDRYGHLACDDVLRTFGALLKRSARTSDIVCRYGDEEFLLVYPHLTQNRAAERAHGLRRALGATLVPHGAREITVTASFGVASYPHDGRTCGELIAAAHRALRAAKSAGGNRVRVSTPGGAPGLHLVR